MAKQYLNVAYKDKDLVKRLGGRWDAGVQRWYCPRGSALSRIFSWRAAQTVPETTLGAESSFVQPASHRPKSSRQKRPVQLSLLG